MERLSNQYADLHNELKKELFNLTLGNSEKCVAAYSEIPWFPGGQISISLVSDSLNRFSKVVKKSWDNEYDLKRFSSGVFNLDRLCINTDMFLLPFEQMEECKKIFNNITFFPETLEKTDYIVLDGIEYELKIQTDNIDKKYTWKSENEDIRHFRPLINFLLAIAIE